MLQSVQNLAEVPASIPAGPVDLQAELLAEIAEVKRNLEQARNMEKMPLQSIERLSRHKMNMIGQLAALQELEEPELPPMEADEALHVLRLKFAQLAPMDRERILEALTSYGGS
jgi:hypothetical protein